MGIDSQGKAGVKSGMQRLTAVIRWLSYFLVTVGLVLMIDRRYLGYADGNTYKRPDPYYIDDAGPLAEAIVRSANRLYVGIREVIPTWYPPGIDSGSRVMFDLLWLFLIPGGVGLALTYILARIGKRGRGE